MENNYVGNKGAEVLKTFLKANRNVIKLSITRNCIGEKQLLEIGEILK